MWPAARGSVRRPVDPYDSFASSGFSNIVSADSLGVLGSLFRQPLRPGRLQPVPLEQVDGQRTNHDDLCRLCRMFLTQFRPFIHSLSTMS